MSILDNAKEVAKAVHEINNLELYQRVLNLHSDIIALVEENNRLRDENKDLTKTISLKQAMKFKKPFYYQDGDQTPYCPSCWESKTTAVHVTFGYNAEEESRWDCPSCKHMYLVRKNRGVRSTSNFEPSGGGGPNDWMRY
jgi:transposase-like protein